MTPHRARSILLVAPHAGPDEIEAAFRRAIRLAHPDRGGDPGRALLLLDARRCLRQASGARPTASSQRVVVVPTPTGRGLVAALVHRVRRRAHRPIPRVR